MRSYVAPIGYDSTRVTRPILSQGIGADTHIDLLIPTTTTDNSRGAQAINDVRQMVKQIEPNVDIETTEIPHDDFETAIQTCRSLIDAADGEVIVIFGGGARDIFFPLTVAALSRTHHIDASYQFSDIDGEVRERTLPDLTANAPAQTESTLETIVTLDAPVSLTEITDAMDVSKSTITRHVKLLERQGLVRSETHGKTKVVELTTTGRILTS
ncbi:CRISPR locus-related DNA-binding protein [Haloarcula sp. JP-Z28]|uniref:CRISPR-associated CARF protein Csa3 n=1 Tax=Haloarcula sp. JP-Z28 TaxID=2716715 RepID=UPI00140477EA|nr:CRISPR-associated CARF protein Csa3 [Haloarcula sp. JP-Z28]NHN64364.1 CRISPR locus-related DNA-binding protein [Haloarcula sp. JP-Z28]